LTKAGLNHPARARLQFLRKGAGIGGKVPLADDRDSLRPKHLQNRGNRKLPMVSSAYGSEVSAPCSADPRHFT